MYKAAHPGLPVRVYFLTYEESVEVSRYSLMQFMFEADACGGESIVGERG